MDYVKVIVEIIEKAVKVIKKEILGKEGNSRDEKNSE